MKTLPTPLAAGACCLTFTLAASAQILLSVVPDARTIHVGEVTTVDLVISGLPTTQIPFPSVVTGIGAYSLYLGYGSFLNEPDVVTATTVTFPSPPASRLDLGGVGSFQHFDLAPLGFSGLVELDETSFEDPGALRQSQYVNVDPATLTAGFTLASISFTGTAVGKTDLSFQAADLSDAAGLPLSGNIFAADGVITVVPEPAEFGGVVGLAVAAFAGLRKIRKA